MRRLLTLAAVWITITAMPAPPASALTVQQVRCVDVAARVARRAGARTFQLRQKCILRRLHGEVDATVDCLAYPEELGGDGTGDLDTDRRLAKLMFTRDAAGDSLSNTCDDDQVEKDVDPVDVGLEDICGVTPSTDWREVANCLIDLGVFAGTMASEPFHAHYDPLDVNPPFLPVTAGQLNCIKEAGEQARAVFGSLTLFRAKCAVSDQLIQDGGGFYDCAATIMPYGRVDSTLYAKADVRLSVPVELLHTILRRTCDKDIDKLGYAAAVPARLGGRFVDRVTLEDVVHYSLDRLHGAVNLLTFGNPTIPQGGIFPAVVNGFCGDGATDAGEDCDDGNNDSCDGCDRDCTSPTCGNGAACAPEECDDGNNVDGDGCSAFCISELCGNGALNLGYDEECDDGGESFTCDTDCTIAYCGDGTNNSVRGEVCDLGGGAPANDPDCDSDCTLPNCMDGHVNPVNTSYGSVTGVGEECDDGAQTADCDTNCTLAFCGDATINVSRGEVCDDGDNDDDDPCVSSDTEVGSNCQPATCGDGFLCSDALSCTTGPTGTAEFCDGGREVPLGSAESTTCNSDCSPAACGDSKINATAGEECDAGALSTVNNPCTDACKDAICGDGKLCSSVSCTTGPTGGIEGCDDGNSIDGDPCRSDCGVATCGDGVACVDPTCTSGPGGTPEACDTSGESSTCDSDCSSAGCGDGDVNATRGETCDDAGESAICDANCTAVTCGDSTVNMTAGEECDDGGANGNANRCRSGCVLATCGDSIVCSGGSCDTAGLGPEDCDDGSETLTCDSNCTDASCGDGDINATRGETCDDGGETASCDSNCSEAFCGDGDTNSTAGETCDDGDDNNNDTCPDDVTASGTCLTATCGDGFTCSAGGCNTAGLGPEQCDTSGESLACDTNCTNASCGDGDVNATRSEVCDDGDVSDNDPCPSGAGGQCLATATCGDAIVCSEIGCTTGAETFGNGNGTEQCDDGDLTDNDMCLSSSSVDRRECVTATCGDGVLCSDAACTTGSTGFGNLDGTEECDDNDLDDSDPCLSSSSGDATRCVVAICGDGIVCSHPSCNTAGFGPEVCDDGASNGSGDGFCLSDCTAVEVCGDGTTNGTEQCDDGNVDDGDGCTATCLDERLVFQTAATFAPGVDFSSLGTADALCQTAASNAGRSGTFMAWLSDGTGSPSTRFTAATLAATGPFVLIDGTRIADSWADLVSGGGVDAAVNLDENASLAGGGDSACTTIALESAVFTNTTAAGALRDAVNTCSNWSSTTGNARFGNGGASGTAWTDSCFGTGGCGASENLYCVEQTGGVPIP